MVFIIKKEIEEEFKEVIGDRISRIMEVQYAYQKLDDLPHGFSVPQGREKPWGTGHAILSCRGLVEAPFAVINADDFYGRHAFRLMYGFLSSAEDNSKYDFAMIGYILKNTLTENGHVARGVCEVADGKLKGICERTRIERRDGHAAYTEDAGESWNRVPDDSIVSMNLWGFTPGIFGELAIRFPSFLKEALAENPLKSEYFLPTVVNALLEEGKAEVSVFPSSDRWYGVTYREDKPVVEKAIRDMITAGVYPERLWEGIL